MLEIIKEQFKSGKTLTQSKYYNYVNRGNWPKFYWDFYPLGQEYYHELNPYFLFKIYKPDILKFSKAITVRDGYLTLSSYLVNNFKELIKDSPRPLLVHKDFASLIPSTLYDRAGCWEVVQKRQINLSQASKVIIFGLVSEEYLGSMENLIERLSPLKEINQDASIELFLPMRKDIFGKNHKDSMAIYHTINYLKDFIPGKKVKFLKAEEFFEITNFKNTYFYDLNIDKMIVADNYLHYYVQSRGATVNNGSLLTPPKDSIFSLDLSIFHELHISPIPKVLSAFPELIFFKKTNPGTDLNFDPNFQQLIRELIDQKNHLS
jgi:hypothetical protein